MKSTKKYPDISKFFKKGVKISTELICLRENDIRHQKLFEAQWTIFLDTYGNSLKAHLSRTQISIKMKKSVLEKLQKIVDKIDKSIKKQLNLLSKDIRVTENEEELIEQLLKLPLFRASTTNQKKSLQHLVSSEKAYVQQMILNLKHVADDLEKRNKALNKFNQGLKYIIREIDTNTGLLLPTYSSMRQNPAVLGMDDFLRLPRPTTENLKRIKNNARLLIKISKNTVRIMKDREKIKKFFNIHDYEQLKKIAGQELESMELRYKFLKKLLIEQRKFHSFHAKKLIAVHLTDHFPDGGVIRPTALFKTKLELSGLKVHLPRHTIHFSMNGAVIGHSSGDWRGKKFGIIIPADRIIDRLININLVDSWVYGKLTLPRGSEIIVLKDKIPEKDIRSYEKKAGNAQVILTKKGESISDAVIRRLHERGFTVMHIGAMGWGSPIFEEERQEFKNVFESAKFKKNYREFVDSMNKLSFHHNNESLVWKRLERVAEEAYNVLNGEESLHYLEMNYKDVKGVLIDLAKERRKWFNTKDEIDAYKSTRKLFVKQGKALKERILQKKKESEVKKP